jgi:hypothetical protein
VWLDIGIVALLLAGVCGFAELTRWRTRELTRRTWRTAENIYDQYADLNRKQRRDARKHADEAAKDPATRA